MDPKWIGPYCIKERVSKGRYKLCSLNGMKLKNFYSSCLLKEYFEATEKEKMQNKTLALNKMFQVFAKKKKLCRVLRHLVMVNLMEVYFM